MKRSSVNHAVPAPRRCFSMTTKRRHAVQNCKRHCWRLCDRYAAGAEMADGILQDLITIDVGVCRDLHVRGN